MISQTEYRRAQYMRAKGISAQQVASAIGVSRSTAYKIGQGRYRQPETDRHCAVCRVRLTTSHCLACRNRRQVNVATEKGSSAVGLTPAQRSRLERPLAELLPSRVANYLASAGMLLVQDVLQRTCRELLCTPGIGAESVRLILNVLERLQFDTSRAHEKLNALMRRRGSFKTGGEATR